MQHTNSLTKNHLFKRLYQKGNKQVTPFLAMYALKRHPSQQHENLLGITVGLKVGNAVVRNKVRRRLREAYRIHEAQLKTGYQIVVVARNRCSTAQYQEIEKSFLLLCDQLDLSLSPKHPVKYQKQSQGKAQPHGRKNTGGKQTQGGKNPNRKAETLKGSKPMG